MLERRQPDQRNTTPETRDRYRVNWAATLPRETVAMPRRQAPRMPATTASRWTSCGGPPAVSTDCCIRDRSSRLAVAGRTAAIGGGRRANGWYGVAANRVRHSFGNAETALGRGVAAVLGAGEGCLVLVEL